MQKAVGITSYYTAALDKTTLIALNDLAPAQAAVKQSIQDSLCQLLYYLVTHPNTKIRYYESPMILQIHSDASYLSAPKA